jgi:hypothetical protein
MILLALLLAAAPRVVYVKAGRLFDGLSESYKQNVALKIENDRIAATNVSIPPGAFVIDLSKATVLPGLIDCHVHLESRADHFEDIWTFKTSPLAPHQRRLLPGATHRGQRPLHQHHGRSLRSEPLSSQRARRPLPARA